MDCSRPRSPERSCRWRQARRRSPPARRKTDTWPKTRLTLARSYCSAGVVSHHSVDGPPAADLAPWYRLPPWLARRLSRWCSLSWPAGWIARSARPSRIWWKRIASFDGSLGRQRLHFTDADRCRPATLGHRLGRRVLRQIATVVRPDTRFYDGIASSSRGSGHTRGSAPVARVCSSRSAAWCCGWRKRIPPGATRIQGVLKNVGHRVGRSTIARILKAHGVAPVPAPDVVADVLRAHWGAVAGADFFTTAVWTWRGLVTLWSANIVGLPGDVRWSAARPSTTARSW